MEKFDQRYLEMAEIWARNSYCKRRQVGAILVKDRMIISDGYNGTPSGFENVCEDENGAIRPPCRGQRHHQGREVRQQQPRGDPLRDGLPVHRMLETDHSGRHKKSRL